MRSNWKRLSVILLFLAAFAFALSGCSGSDGAAGPAGAAGSSAGTDAQVMPAATMAALDPTVTVQSVTISSPPVVKFTIKDGNGNGIKGLGFTKLAATDTMPTLTNLNFKIAKLVPATTSAPSKWVNLTNIVTTPTKTAAGVAVPSVPTRPTSSAGYENTGTLVDNGDGSYTYTFYRDITKIKDTVAAMTVTGANVLADLGDLTYDPTLTHRLVIMLSGSARGTGTNTSNGVQVTPSVALENPKNIIYDFVPSRPLATQAVAATDTQREITNDQVCGSCHYATPGHRGAAVQNCVLCHADQIKYGRSNVNSVLATATSATTGVTTGTLGIAGTYTAPTATVRESWGASGYRIDGETLADFPIMIHKIHMGTSLSKTGFGYNIVGLYLKNLAYPQERANCRKCHNDDVAYAATATTAAHTGTGLQGANWKTKPSRLACGSCHDAINWVTGANHPGIGGARTSDADCALCHSPAYIETNHTTVNATTHNPSVPTGAANFTYEISSVTVSATNQPVVTFRILNGTTPVVFNTYSGATDAAAWTFVQTGLLTNFAGSPSFLVAYADGQDGVTSANMIDFNNLGKSGAQPASVSIAELATGAAGSLAVATASGVPAGSYVATLNTSVSRNWSTGAIGATYGPGTVPPVSALFPATAKMRTVAINGYFTQKNLTDYAYTAPVLGVSNASGGLPRHGIMVMKAVGETATAVGESRRHVVDSVKCASCHEYFEGHGGNRNYNMDGCTVCHVPNLSSSGRAVTLTVPEAAQNLKDMIHGIHSASLRRGVATGYIYPDAYPYKHSRGKAGSQTTYDWSTYVYPGALNQCTMCHIAGTENISAANLGKALATTNVTTSNAAATYNARTSVVTDALATADTFLGTTSTTAVPSGGKYINVKGTVTLARDTLANTTDLVVTPFSASCVSCHASAAARAHMTSNGGGINVTRTIATTGGTVAAGSSEGCIVCHGTGKGEDAAALHSAIAGD